MASQRDIVFTKHAQEKFDVLQRHQLVVPRSHVEEAARQPDAVNDTHQPLLIAEKHFDDHPTLHVVYREEWGVKMIVTFYPVRNAAHANDQ